MVHLMFKRNSVEAARSKSVWLIVTSGVRGFVDQSFDAVAMLGERCLGKVAR